MIKETKTMLSYNSLRRLSHGAVLFTIAAVSIASTPAAYAKNPAPFGKKISHDFVCPSLKNQAENLFAEYPGASANRKAEILNELNTLGRRWEQTGCRAITGEGIGTKNIPLGPPVMTVPDHIFDDPSLNPAGNALPSNEPNATHHGVSAYPSGRGQTSTFHSRGPSVSQSGSYDSKKADTSFPTGKSVTMSHVGRR